MARRIAALLLLGTRLDENYVAVTALPWEWKSSDVAAAYARWSYLSPKYFPETCVSVATS